MVDLFALYTTLRTFGASSSELLFYAKDENGAYQKHTIPMSEYKGYDALKAQALHIPERFYLLDEAEAGELPFP